MQDAGYAALLPAMGVTPETAAAFVVVKRVKEGAWVAFGYVLLAIQRKASPPHSIGCDGTRDASNGMHPLAKGEQAL